MSAGKVPVAVARLQPGRAAKEAELVEFLRGRTARYKVPVRIRLLEALPLTRSDKLHDLALKALAAAGMA
ncbi:MAG: AMP-binding enzyme [Acetobacteraceae bacterium]